MQSLLSKLDYLSQLLVKCVFTVPLTFLAIPLCTFTVLFFFIYRILVIRVARCVGNPDLRRPLDLGSAAISHIQSPFKVTPTIVIVAMGVLEGVPDMERIREQLRGKLFGKKDQNGKPFYPELLQTMECFMGYPFWKRIPGMTVEKALDKYVALHKRIGGCDANYLLDFVKTFAVKQFKEGGPLWEMAFLENYILPGSTAPHFAMVVRMHHTLTDGVGCLSLMQELGEQSSHKVERPRMILPLSYRVYKALSPVYRGVYDVVSHVLNWEAFTSRNSIWPESISPAPELNPEGEPEFSAAYSFSLGTHCSSVTSIRKVSKAWGVSGTAVILTAILRSLRNTLFLGQTMLPTFVEMFLTLSSPKHNGKLTNASFVVSLLLSFYVENPVTHAKKVDEEFQRVKNSSLPYVMEQLIKFVGILPQFIMGPVFRHWWNTRPEHLLLSTMLGPKESLSICGHMTKEISYLLPRGDGLKFPLFQLISTVDKLYLSITADKILIQDDAMVRRMVMGFHDEIENFQKSRQHSYC